MKKNLLNCMFLALLLTTMGAHSTHPENNASIKLRLPSEVPKAQYVKDVLHEAYASIGYNINWFSTSGSYELELVRSGKLTAALARAPIIEKKFPDLIKVPFALLDFKLLKVSDRRRCGYCLDSDINSIIYTKGSHISEQYTNPLRSSIDKLAILQSQNLNEMILKRRADSVLIMDFQLSDEARKNPHILIESVAQEDDFHYLSPKYADLKEPLLAAFKQLELDGTLDALQQQYQITENEVTTLTKGEKINVISGHWLGYTNIDGSGVYWDIVDEAFKEHLTVKKSNSTWARAVRAFELKKVDVLVGTYRNEQLNNVIYSSYHIDYEWPLFAYMRDQKTLTRFQAKDKTLLACLVTGSSLIEHVSFLSSENIIQTAVAQCELLLTEGKVDVIIEYSYNLSEQIRSFPHEMLKESAPIFLAFHDTPKGKALKLFFDKRIKALAIDNKLQLLFPNEESYQQAHIHPQ
jgi:ABC-type amino acid transport substrate-binding protein